MTIHHLVREWGYWAVFLLVAVESLGVPLPGETVLVAAATYAGATHPHRLSVWLIFLVASAAAIIGDTTGYWIGDKGGYWLLRRYGHYVRIDQTKVKLAHYLFDRRGGTVVFFGRFVSILRTYAAFLAGTTRMRYRTFLAFNVSGGIVWAAVYTFVAYYAASWLSRVSTPFEIGAASVAVVAIVAGLLVVRRHIGSLSARAEAAYPGPIEGFRDGDGAGGRSDSGSGSGVGGPSGGPSGGDP
jgi:membrane protein DedA with SNARE-associated domain